MTIDATFWVAVSFFIFIAGLIYLKMPQKINLSLTNKINEIKKELENAEKLKNEAKNLLSNYEKKIDKSKNESKEITAGTTDDPSSANSTFTDWSIIYKHNDKRDLSTFLHFGDDKILLTVNSKTDDNLFPKYPHSQNASGFFFE